jgi:hypothetical protein
MEPHAYKHDVGGEPFILLIPLVCWQEGIALKNGWEKDKDANSVNAWTAKLPHRTQLSSFGDLLIKTCFCLEHFEV